MAKWTARAAGQAAYVAEFSRQESLRAYVNALSDYRLDDASERALGRRIRRGDKSARQQLIEANLRLVIEVAKNYAGLGLPVLDLIEAGNEGLIIGVDKYNPTHASRARFATHASEWIRAYIVWALATEVDAIRIPYNLWVARNRAIKAKSYGITDNVKLAAAARCTPRELARIMRVRQPLSLDQTTPDSEDSTLGDIVADEMATVDTSLDRVDEASEASDLVARLMKVLTATERRVIALRFGLNGGQPMILEAVAKQMGFSRERARQYEERALRKMRASGLRLPKAS